MLKVSVIGSGNVGATCAFEIARRNLAQVVLVDVVEGLAQGKSLDMNQASSFLKFNPQILGTNNFEEIVFSEVVVITAGLPRKPGMSRIDLLKTNAEIVKRVVEKVKKFAPHSKIIVITNPLDVMVFLALKVSNFPRERVIGMGGSLDSARFKYFLSLLLNVPLEDVSAMVIGAHGDTMVPLTQLATVRGKSIYSIASSQVIEKVVERTRNGGAEIVSLLKTGSAFYAPAMATAEMVESILLDQKKIISTAFYLQGEYGFSDVVISLPIVLGKNGVEKLIELNLSQETNEALAKSVKSVEEAIKELKTVVNFESN